MPSDNQKEVEELVSEAKEGFKNAYGLEMSEVESCIVNEADLEYAKVLKKYLDYKSGLMMRQAFDCEKALDYNGYLAAHALVRAVNLIRTDMENIRQVYSDFVSELARLQKSEGDRRSNA